MAAKRSPVACFPSLPPSITRSPRPCLSRQLRRLCLVKGQEVEEQKAFLDVQGTPCCREALGGRRGHGKGLELGDAARRCPFQALFPSASPRGALSHLESCWSSWKGAGREGRCPWRISQPWQQVTGRALLLCPAPRGAQRGVCHVFQLPFEKPAWGRGCEHPVRPGRVTPVG